MPPVRLALLRVYFSLLYAGFYVGYSFVVVAFCSACLRVKEFSHTMKSTSFSRVC